MNFFDDQEQARRNTVILITLFIISTVLISMAVYFAIVAGVLIGQMFAGQGGSFTGFSLDQLKSWQLFYWSTGITLLVISGGSIYRIHTLSEGGGAAVARMLGGRKIPSASRDLLERRVLNVVEEMAIASGLPVPPVYLLEQQGINAFAAAFTASDAVIGVTRGAIELLNRDQLQGVIAHEFSHILNGDSAMKMRMMGLLYGITLLSDSGIMLISMRRGSRYSRDRGTHPALLVIGLLLFIVGTVGAVMADLIKLAVSRQREFLADASAVQFTRNPSGIADALKVIGGYKNGSKVNHSAASQASHLFFGHALKSWYSSSWWATHPPLDERIRRIEPEFKGEFDKIDDRAIAIDNRSQAAAEMLVSSAAPIKASPLSVDTFIAKTGSLNIDSIHEASVIMAAIPARIRDFSHDPYTARAVVYALLLHQKMEKRGVQLQLLERAADPNVFREMLDIMPEIEKLSPVLRLPLAAMVMPALKELSLAQYKQFKKAVDVLIKADHQVALFEFALYRMVIRRLAGEFGRSAAQPVKYRQIKDIYPHVSVLLALLARVDDGERAVLLFAGSMAMLQAKNYPMPDRKRARLSDFDKALTQLNMATPSLKKLILRAALHCVAYDGLISVKEGELMRVIADALDCPVPPTQQGG